MNTAAIVIDGSYGEGGGQLVRTAVALAAVTGRDTVIRNIRKKRHPSGLAPQHLAAVSAVAHLCDARMEGAELRSHLLRFTPGNIARNHVRCDVGTAGSIALVLQALLPAMIVGKQRTAVTVTGGTDVRQAPSIDYFRLVFLPLLSQMGVRVNIEVVHRGYYPKGGGEIRAEIGAGSLQPTHWEDPGALVSIKGNAHVANLPVSVANRMRDAAIDRLTAVTQIAPTLSVNAYDRSYAVGTGAGITIAARTEHSFLGAARTAERGVAAETLGNAVSEELAADLMAGASVDQHAADQMLIFLALAGGGSLVTRVVSTHAQTVMWLIEHCLPIRFVLTEVGALSRITVTPSGLTD